jgi:hypothetical protein
MTPPSLDQALRDPIWQFVGVAISILALLVSVIAIRVQQRKKSLCYAFSNERPILYVFDEKLKSRLTLSLDGMPVQGLSTYEVAVFNDGNVAVLPTDFIEPIRIEFGSNSKILAVAVTDSAPQDLNVTVAPNGATYSIEPTLLNPGDEFVVQFLVDQSEREHYSAPTVRARVAGVQQLRLRSSRPAGAWRAGFYRFVLARAAPVFTLGIVSAVSSNWLYDLITRLLHR